MPWGATHRGRVAVAIVATAVLCVASAMRTDPPLGAHTAHADVRPNIVLIMTDDMRWDELENMPKTMAFLAAQGIRFTQAFVPNSLCCPSRTSLLTGQYSNHNGVWNNAAPYGGFDAFAHGYTRPDGVVVDPHETHTIAVTLHDAGYRTALVGKYLNQYGKATAGGLAARPGWDVWDTFLDDPNYFTYTLDHYGKAMKHGTGAANYSTDVLGADAVSFIDHAPTDQPFFLEFTPYAPHAPFRPAPRYAKALKACPTGHVPPGCYLNETSPNIAEADVSDKPAWVRALKTGAGSAWNGTRRKQELTLLSVDDWVDRIRLELQTRGILSNTLIVFTSDNSLSGGSHRWTNKQSPWDEAIHVPLLMRYDPLTSSRAGAVDDTDAPLNIDLAPTFADLGGATPPAGEWAYDGESLVPELAGSGSIVRTSFPLEHLVGGDEAGAGRGRTRPRTAACARARIPRFPDDGCTCATTRVRKSCTTWPPTRGSSTAWTRTRPTTCSGWR